VPGALGIDRADDRQDEQASTDPEDGRRQLADGLLLPSDHALPLDDDHVHHQLGSKDVIFLSDRK
jgi:hypothetical protein